METAAASKKSDQTAKSTQDSKQLNRMEGEKKRKKPTRMNFGKYFPQHPGYLCQGEVGACGVRKDNSSCTADSRLSEFRPTRKGRVYDQKCYRADYPRHYMQPPLNSSSLSHRIETLDSNLPASSQKSNTSDRSTQCHTVCDPLPSGKIDPVSSVRTTHTSPFKSPLKSRAGEQQSAFSRVYELRGRTTAHTFTNGSSIVASKKAPTGNLNATPRAIDGKERKIGNFWGDTAQSKVGVPDRRFTRRQVRLIRDQSGRILASI